MKCLLFAILLLACTFCLAQDQSITIIDGSTHQPVGGAKVTDDHHVSVTSGNNGSANIGKLASSGSFSISAPGYQNLTVSYDQLAADSFKVSLTPKVFNVNEVTVTGNRPSAVGMRSPSSVNALSAREFYRGNDMYLHNLLNTVPGVRMQVRSATSQSNILIRGMGGKSRFGMRDVRVYYNGLPLTEADGTTTLNDVDFSAFGSAQVVKGPTSIQYGSGTAGAIVFNTKKARFQEMDFNETSTFGADGLFRSNTNYRAGTANSNMYASYGYQKYDGYRAHSASKKSFLTLSGDYYPSEAQTLTALVMATSTNDDFPGELNATDYNNNPQIANQAYIDKNIGYHGNSFYAGAVYGYNFTPEMESSIGVFVGNSFSQQPIEPFFNRLSLSKAGVRAVFSWSPTVSGKSVNVTAGTEIIRNLNIERHYAISASGTQGALNLDREYDLASYIAFFQAGLGITSMTSLNAGFRVNGANYLITDNLKPGGVDFSGQRKIDPYVTPLVSVVHTLNEQTSLFAIYSGGFSAPTTSEISLSNGLINTDLAPEKTSNLEAGVRGSSADGKFTYTASTYWIWLRDSNVPQRINGISYQVNAGKSENRGAELYATYDYTLAEGSLLRGIRPFASLSYTQFKYKDYINNGVDYTDKAVPGVAPLLLDLGVDLSSPTGLYLDLTYFLTDKRNITDDNTVTDPSYSLLNLKAGWRKRLAKGFTLQVFGGVDNLTGTKYSPTLAVNQTSLTNGLPVYYNPASGANGYGALNIEFHFAE